MNNTILPWTEKYRPSNLSEVILSQDLYNYFSNCIKHKMIPHMILHGPPGTGKTSVIRAIGRELFKEFYSERLIEFNASDERGIAAVRGRITKEAKLSINYKANPDTIPPFKIIVLDEADSMTDEAQDALRIIIEEYSLVTRFIFICNYPNKITPAIKSRCSIHDFKKLSDENMLKKINDIMIKENITLEENLIKTLLNVTNGDMRKSIVLLQKLKYVIEMKDVLNKKIDNMTGSEMRKLNKIIFANIDPELTEEDIYELMPTISPSKSKEILEFIINCTNIKESINYARDIIGLGYPVDDTIQKLIIYITNNKQVGDKIKSNIIKKSVEVLIKIKKGSDDTIQLIEMFNIIYTQTRNN